MFFSLFTKTPYQHRQAAPPYRRTASVVIRIQGLDNGEVGIDGVQILVLIMKSDPCRGVHITVVAMPIEVVGQALVQGPHLLGASGNARQGEAGVRKCPT